jgi:anti-sigma-K factor RskA
MRLEDHALLDALCGEYLVGTLRGAARRRFERALRDEPRVALRLRHWERLVAPRYTRMMEAEPPRDGWRRLERELGLGRYRTPWYQRHWRVAAAVASLVLVIALAIQFVPRGPELQPIAHLTGKDVSFQVNAYGSRDGSKLALRASRVVIAATSQSYELWLIPEEGGDPISLAVLAQLDAEFVVPDAYRHRLRSGATLAVSTEPAGGSPTGKPTGPVIVMGRISG